MRSLVRRSLVLCALVVTAGSTSPAVAATTAGEVSSSRVPPECQYYLYWQTSGDTLICYGPHLAYCVICAQ